MQAKLVHQEYKNANRLELTTAKASSLVGSPLLPRKANREQQF